MKQYKTAYLWVKTLTSSSLLIILSATFMVFRAWGQGREELTARQRGKLGSVVQADGDNQNFQAPVLAIKRQQDAGQRLKAAEPRRRELDAEEK